MTTKTEATIIIASALDPNDDSRLQTRIVNVSEIVSEDAIIVTIDDGTQFKFVSEAVQMPQNNELNETEHRTTFYDTMFEYVKDADISHYRMSAPKEPDSLIISFGFQPCGDPDICIDYDTRIQHNGDTYFPICWGEPEKSAIRENAVDESCYIRYIYNFRTTEYVSDGRVYDTREDAEAV